MPATLNHHTAKSFRDCLENLPQKIQQLAHNQYALLKEDPTHPSLRFKRKDPSGYYAARVNDSYRALAIKTEDGAFLWIWIGSHKEYERLIKHKR